MWIRRSGLPRIVVTSLVFLGLGAIACIPLGGWLYSDPTFTLSGVSTKFRGSPADTLQFVLTGCNLNDFDLEGLTIDGRLLVDGVPVGLLRSARGFTMKLRDSVDVMVPLEMPRSDEPSVHAKGDDPLIARYELNGKIDLTTPIGVRHVVLHQVGDVRFDSAGQTSGWTVRNVRPCKPGQSVLPGQGVQPRMLLDTMFRPQTPVVGSPGQRDGI